MPWMKSNAGPQLVRTGAVRLATARSSNSVSLSVPTSNTTSEHLPLLWCPGLPGAFPDHLITCLSANQLTNSLARSLQTAAQL